MSLIPAISVIADQPDEPAISTGTGWAVAPHFVVTNHHVVGKASTVTLVRTDNRRLKADVVMRDPINDVAVLKPRKTRLLPPGLPMASASSNVGANVFTIGYPLLELMGREPKLTTGIVNARTGIADDPRTYQISIPLQPGNSGGPVLNMKGEVIGIATSSLNAAAVFNWSRNLPQNVNYAVKINYVRALVDAAPVHGKHRIGTMKAKAESLEALVQRVKDSVFVVIAEEPQAASIKQVKVPAPPRKPSKKPATKTSKKQTYALYVYMRPHNYDIRDGNTTAGIDDTTINYSTTVGNLIKHKVEQASKGRLVLKANLFGAAAKKVIYNGYKKNLQGPMCKREKVDFVFSAMNYNSSVGMMEITYFIYNCKSRADFYYTKALSYENNEHYMYEVHLKKLLKSMLSSIPSDVGFLVDSSK